MPIRLMVALFAICATAFTTNVYAAYGRTVGNFGVSALGSAQYSIPIWAPPGPRGIQPQVSLSYDSDQWIGPMGIGWALGGLGQITRCNKTVAQDGASAAVGLSASDGYCFNGNRLRMVTGTYGAAGSTYQTEIADFSNITANGTAGNGPEYWSVRAKNGLTYYFGFVDANGNGANSAPVAQGTTTVLTWFLSKVIDRAGNNYVVNYTAQTGTAVPASILWTPTSYGASTYAYKMLFNYSGNNPATSSIQYVDGTLVSNTELLSSIEILAGGVVIKDYFLGYQLSPSTGRNEMISVLECADTGKANCLLPTSISYQGGSPGVSTTPNTAAPGGAQLTARYDLNGDGYPDLFYAVGSTMYVAFGSATGYQTPFNTGIPTTAVVGRLTGGIQDAVLANNGGTWYYYNWNGSSFTGTSTKISYDTSSAGYQLADINGDGLPDLIDLNYVYSSFTKKYTASIITILNTTAGGTFGLSETSNTAYSAVVVSAQLLPPDTQYGKLRRYDFNGDGLDDIVLKTITGTSSNYYINTEELISNGSGFTAQTISSALNGSYAPVFFTDWNDDRCTDFVSVNVLYIAGCNGTAAETYSLPGTLLLAFDWNADGRTDILVANGSTLGVYLAGGSGAPTLTSTTSTSPRF